MRTIILRCDAPFDQPITIAFLSAAEPTGNPIADAFENPSAKPSQSRELFDTLAGIIINNGIVLGGCFTPASMNPLRYPEAALCGARPTAATAR